MVTVYMQPWTRFGPYAIGIALGIIMYWTKCRVRLPKVCKQAYKPILCVYRQSTDVVGGVTSVNVYVRVFCVRLQ